MRRQISPDAVACKSRGPCARQVTVWHVVSRDRDRTERHMFQLVLHSLVRCSRVWLRETSWNPSYLHNFCRIYISPVAFIYLPLYLHNCRRIYISAVVFIYISRRIYISSGIYNITNSRYINMTVDI